MVAAGVNKTSRHEEVETRLSRWFDRLSSLYIAILLLFAVAGGVLAILVQIGQGHR